MGLDNFLGPIGAGFAVLVVTGIIGFLLVRYGAAKLAVLGGDDEEKTALKAGEQRV
jgi:hypothetical protein